MAISRGGTDSYSIASPRWRALAELSDVGVTQIIGLPSPTSIIYLIKRVWRVAVFFPSRVGSSFFSTQQPPFYQQQQTPQEIYQQAEPPPVVTQSIQILPPVDQPYVNRKGKKKIKAGAAEYGALPNCPLFHSKQPDAKPEMSKWTHLLSLLRLVKVGTLVCCRSVPWAGKWSMLCLAAQRISILFLHFIVN